MGGSIRPQIVEKQLSVDKQLSPARAHVSQKKPKLFTSAVPYNIKPCNHGVQLNFRKLEIRSFFNERYYQKTVNAPQKCGHCAISFGDDYKVGSRNPVYACENSQNITHECDYALCKVCYSSWVNCAEIIDADGSCSINNNDGKRTRRGCNIKAYAI